MVSMKDIAARCGVSVATVSKALNDHDDIGIATKETIGRIAREMGYFPNSSARALKTRRTYNLGVLFVDQAMSGLTHDYFAHVLDSFKRVAEKRGYDITFISCEKHRSMTYLEHSYYRGVDGVVIACVDFSDANVIELIHSDMPTVTIDHTFNDTISVVSDNVKGMQDLAEYVYSMGHRNVAYIYGDNTSVTQNRLRSFYRSFEEKGISVPDEHVIGSTYRNPEQAFLITKRLLDMKDRPSCIFYPDDYSAVGGMNAIKEAGLDIPGDISLVGYDGSSISRITDPNLTTLAQNTAEIGRIAADKLIQLIENPKTTLIERIIVAGDLTCGQSVGRV